VKNPLLAVVALSLCSSSAFAAPSYKEFRQWSVKIDADAFDDGKSSVIAISSGQDGSGVGLRCLHGRATVALREARPRYKVGQKFEIKFRADRGPVLSTSGDAVSDNLVQLDQTAALISAMRGARSLAFRVATEGVAFDRNFDAG
jgi:hypothetical protein